MKKQRHGPPKLEITATVYHITRQESYYQVCFQTVDGEPKEILMGREVFSKPARVVDELLKAHAALPDSTKAAIKLVKRALAKKSNRLFRVTSRTGWYGDSFVYLTETFGSLDGKMQHEGHTDIDPALGQQLGKMKTWREGMRRPCKYSDFLIFTISIATSGPLLELIGEDEGAIYHLQPEHRANSSNTQRKVTSSSGKTLAARAGLSVIGRCRKSDLVTFAATERGVEDFCFAHNHLVAVFDEEGRALTAGHGLNSSVLPYLVTSGVGKLRSNKATRDRDLQNLRWSLPAISTGENPLDDPSKRAARAEGAQARMIPVPVPPGDNGGIFNLVEGSVSNAAKKCRNLARHLEKTIEANYGVLMPAYLKKLVPEKPEISRRVRLIIDRFVKRVRADQDPWEQRFAAKFGIVLAAAILLSEFGLAPWTKKRARKAITAIYKKARRATSVSTDEAADALLSVVRKHVKAGKRFPTLNKGQELATKRASSAWGAIVKVPGIGRIVAVPYTRVEGLVKPAAITQPVLRTLADRKVVVQSSDGKLTRQVMLKGVTGTKRPRRVCFDYNKIMKPS